MKNKLFPSEIRKAYITDGTDGTYAATGPGTAYTSPGTNGAPGINGTYVSPETHRTNGILCNNITSNNYIYIRVLSNID